jgi:hypothetical protein
LIKAFQDLPHSLILFHISKKPIMRYSIAGLASLAVLATAVDPVEVRGQDFVNSVSGDRFVVIGVDYQPGGQGALSTESREDVLSNPEACTRDAALMQTLGVNTIRSYNVNPVC